MTLPPVILLGAGGHAKVVLDLLHDTDRRVLGVCDPLLENEIGGKWRDIPVLGEDSALLNHSPDAVQLANGVGSLPGHYLREQIHRRFTDQGYTFATLIHPRAVISKSANLAHGVQVMAGCVIQADVLIGESTLLNTSAHVDHDCQLGAHVHIAPGAVLSGGVKISSRVHIGPNATLVQGVSIGSGAVVGAGTTVLRDLAAHHQLIGQAPRTPSPL